MNETKPNDSNSNTKITLNNSNSNSNINNANTFSTVGTDSNLRVSLGSKVTGYTISSGPYGQESSSASYNKFAPDMRDYPPLQPLTNSFINEKPNANESSTTSMDKLSEAEGVFGKDEAAERSSLCKAIASRAAILEVVEVAV